MNSNFKLVETSYILFILITAFPVSKLFIRLVVSLLENANCIRKNFRGKNVVHASGIAFIPVVLTMTSLCMLIFPSETRIYSSYIVGVCTIGFAGVVDDLIGEKDIKGLRNHLKSMLYGHLTTGFFKACIGIIISIFLSANISKDALGFTLNMLNIALFTNTLNLMDLRPGRCVKTFIILGGLIFVINIRNIVSLLPLGIILIAAFVYLAYDLKELCMLGDTGSNILGITLGYYSSYYSTLIIKLILVIALLSINIAAEKVSFTAIISRNRFLNYLDSIGRGSM